VLYVMYLKNGLVAAAFSGVSQHSRRFLYDTAPSPATAARARTKCSKVAHIGYAVASGSTTVNFRLNTTPIPRDTGSKLEHAMNRCGIGSFSWNGIAALQYKLMFASSILRGAGSERCYPRGAADAWGLTLLEAR
jgi:hypothetical protein